MKRVYCLYRVSTIHQLCEDDIPMQRQACQGFAQNRGWKITHEFYEKGISGFKTPTSDRYVLQQIKCAAEAQEFDILLVFMFDRLGRRDSETPFWVEELSILGIEIWSVIEGQQRFDSHADRLINYIRYWQAYGESLKISDRVKTRMQQMTSQGIYCGGTCPYGYRYRKKGRTNAKGYEVNDLEIDPAEAAVVRKIFDYYIHSGYGPRKISTELFSHGMLDRRKDKFHPSSITAILHRELVTGIISRGGARSDIIQHLQIITPETFQKAQNILRKRKDGQLPRRISGKALMSGNLYCGHCGGRMFATTQKQIYCGTDPRIEHIPIYKCYNRVQHKHLCTGQTSYRAGKIDSEILRQLSQYVEDHPACSPIYEKAMQSEFSIKKMIICQWVERASVFSYDRIQITATDHCESI